MLKNLFYRFVIRSWSMWLFLFCFYLAYLHLVHQKQKEIDEVLIRLDHLTKEKDIFLVKNQELTQKIDSQNDPEWIEQILKKKTGVVREGQVKVQFTPSLK